MALTSTKVADTKSILTPSITLKGHGDWIESISYFPDGQRMISGSDDTTTRQWDLKMGKEIEEARGVCEGRVYGVAVSRNGRWVATGGGDLDRAELKACEVETGILKTFKGHSQTISCIDVSADNRWLASGSEDETVRIWNLDTGRLAAGPFKSGDWVGAVRFSPDSRKLAVKSWPIFWTNNNKTIIAAFRFTKDDIIKTIYEFDASTLETVGTPFKGHTKRVTELSLSFDDVLLASASFDNTIKLWAFESRQLLASFEVQNIFKVVLSPNSHQLAYTTRSEDSHKIYICDTPPKVLAQARKIARTKSNLGRLLHSHATRLPARHRKPPIYTIPTVQRPPPTNDSQKPSFLQFSKILRFPRTNIIPVRHIQPRDPLDVPATFPLPSSLSAQPASRFDHFEIGSPSLPSNGVVQSLRQHLSFLVPRHSHGPPVVEVAPGRKFTRLAAAKLPEYKKVDDTRHPASKQGDVPQETDTADVDSLPDVHWCKAFLCYSSCLSHGRLRMPPRWRLERVDVPRQDGAANNTSGGSHSRS
ncbi:WD40-repeat-containing domain protein [Suillus occidentalis]|nr:WD40-repeat-containing domain protein [Suillus occidentalis]